MTLFYQLPKEQQAKIREMTNDLVALDNKMLDSLKKIQGKYEWHRDFIKEFLKGNRTMEQFEAFLKKDQENPGL